MFLADSEVIILFRVFALLVKLFSTEHDGVDVLIQLERRRMLIDRFVLLLSAGYALPVTHYMRQKLEKQDTDISLIRYAYDFPDWRGRDVAFHNSIVSGISLRKPWRSLRLHIRPISPPLSCRWSRMRKWLEKRHCRTIS